jgi:hypothetical protein
VFILGLENVMSMSSRTEKSRLLRTSSLPLSVTVNSRGYMDLLQFEVNSVSMYSREVCAALPLQDLQKTPPKVQGRAVLQLCRMQDAL